MEGDAELVTQKQEPGSVPPVSAVMNKPTEIQINEPGGFHQQMNGFRSTGYRVVNY